jgi:hypothetical protein
LTHWLTLLRNGAQAHEPSQNEGVLGANRHPFSGEVRLLQRAPFFVFVLLLFIDVEFNHE